jgi:predicted Zn-dependent protease
MEENNMMKPIPAFFTLSLGLFLLSVQQVQGQSGPSLDNILKQLNQTMSVQNTSITPDEEYYIGRAVAASLLRNYRPYTAQPELTEYVNMICQALVLNSPKPVLFNGYHVMILDSTEINAFATSGGHIFVTKGLVDSVDSEDALAAVLAHEIAHIQLRHNIESLEDGRLMEYLTGIARDANRKASKAAGLSSEEQAFTESIRSATDTLIRNGYSQWQEFAADDTALALLASAGYAPSGLIDMLRRLQQTQRRHPGGFNTTHPSPVDRILNANRTINNYPVQKNTDASRPSRFLAVRSAASPTDGSQ